MVAVCSFANKNPIPRVAIVKTITSIISTKDTLKPIIEHDGKRYGFIPSLDDITVGEQADIDAWINDWQKMDKVMAVLYRPITHERNGKYLIEEYTGKERPLDLSMDIVQGALVFFYNLLNDLLSYTQNYLKEAAHQTKASQILAQNGVGIKTFTESLEGIFFDLKQSISLN